MRRSEMREVIDGYADGFLAGATAIIDQVERYDFDIKNPKHIEILRNAAKEGAEATREVKALL